MPYINTKHLFQCNTCRYHNKSGCATLCDHGEQYIPDMKKIPEADVVEVCRCKECKHSYFVKSCSKYECRKGCGILKYSNDYCSYGEKRSDT